MKFLCFVCFRPDAFADATPEEIRWFSDYTVARDNRLRQSGHLLFVAPLNKGDQTVAVDRRHIKMDEIDEPFADAKEIIGGVMLMEARQIEELTALLQCDPFNAHSTLVITSPA